MTESIDREATSAIVEEFGGRPEMLVQILQAIVSRYGWIPEDAIRQLALELNLSRADVHGVVSYYHDFRTEAPGRHIIKICQAEACQAMGSRELTRHACQSLGTAMHGTANDVTLEPVYCLGNCACAPAVMVNDRTHGRIDKTRFDALVARLGAAS